MEPKSILIVSYYFPPSSMVAAPRIYSFAKYLAEYGHDVTVLCCNDSKHCADSSLEMDCSTFKTVHVEIGAVEFKHIDYYYQQSLLSDRKLDKYVWKGKDAFFRFLAKIKNGLVGNLLMPEDSWLAAAWREARRLVAAKKYDVLITSSGPIVCHFIGYGLKKKHNDLVWIADYRDPWLNNPNWTRPVWPLVRIQSLLQKKLNDYADALITVSDQLAKDFFKNYASKIILIENGYFHLDALDKHVPDRDKFIISYTGTYYDESYSCDEFFAGIKKAIEHGVVKRPFEINFFGTNTNSIIESAKKYGLSDVVFIHPRVNRQASLAIQRASDAVVFFSSQNELYRGFYSAKIFEYLNSGVPIIVTGNTEDNCAAKLVDESGAGFVCGSDSYKVYEALVKIMNRDLPERNKTIIESFRRDRLATKLVDLVEQLCQRTSK